MIEEEQGHRTGKGTTRQFLNSDSRWDLHSMTAAFEGGVSEFQLGHFEGAVRCFEEAAYASPNDVRVLMWLASAYLQNQQVEAAVTVYRRLLSFPDGKVRRFAQNGIRACGQPDLSPAIKGTLIRPLIETELLPTLRMPSLSIWDITTAAFRIAGEEWGNFALSSFSGYFLLLVSVGASLLLIGANAALSGGFKSFLNLFYQPGSSLTLFKSGFYPLTIGISALFVVGGMGNWLMSLLRVQRWAYYVYVGQAYPFWQTQQTLGQRLSSMGWSVLVVLLLSLPLCLSFLQVTGWLALSFALVSAVFLACSLVALPVLAVENKNVFSALVRSWQLSYRHFWLVACLALLILFVWPSLCFSISGWVVACLPRQWPIVAHSAVQLFTIFGLYTLAFPGIGTLLGTLYYDLVTRGLDQD
jgi:Tetratricopeptide repeat